jgi:hypothetical protein
MTLGSLGLPTLTRLGGCRKHDWRSLLHTADVFLKQGMTAARMTELMSLALHLAASDLFEQIHEAFADGVYTRGLPPDGPANQRRLSAYTADCMRAIELLQIAGRLESARPQVPGKTRDSVPPPNDRKKKSEPPRIEDESRTETNSDLSNKSVSEKGGLNKKVRVINESRD